MNIRLPLYDVFGYLLPGIVAMLAVGLVIWSVYLPSVSLAFIVVPKQAWVLLAVLAYFAGHFVQALGNVFSDLLERPEERVFGEGAQPDCKVLVKQAHSLLHSEVGVTNVSPLWTYRLCDATVLHSGTTSEREIFVYREGFYRGASVSFALLTIGLLVRCFAGTTSFLWNGGPVFIPRSLLVLLLAISSAGSALMISRFHRFAQYRVRHALISFLLIHKKQIEVKNA